MAADLVRDPTIEHTFVHDLESAFYVVLWLSIRFLPNSWSSKERGTVMSVLFNPDVDTPAKSDWMVMVEAHLADFKVFGNPVLTKLITSLAKLFRARHMERSGQSAPDPDDDGSGQSTPDPDDELPSYVDEEKLKLHLSLLDNHDAMISRIGRKLDTPKWPKVEPAIKQDIIYSRRAGRSSSKKSKSYLGRDTGKLGSSQKRSRTE